MSNPSEAVGHVISEDEIEIKQEVLDFATAHIRKIESKCQRVDGDHLIWQGAINSKCLPQVKVGGKTYVATRFLYACYLSLAGSQLYDNEYLKRIPACSNHKCLNIGHLTLWKSTQFSLGIDVAQIYSNQQFSKLSDSIDFEYVKKLYSHNGLTMRTLAERFSISVSTVHRIIHS